MKAFVARFGIVMLAAVAACTHTWPLVDGQGSLRIEVAVTDTAQHPVAAQLQVHLQSIAAQPLLVTQDWLGTTDSAGRYAVNYLGIWVQDTVRVRVIATPPDGSGLSPAVDSAVGIYFVAGAIPLDTVRLTLILR